jgi:uncharacterized protein YndB with AHSA1/START domain
MGAHATDGAAGGAPEVTRSIVVDAPAEAVWAEVADPSRRRGWLDDEEATCREVRIDTVDDGHGLVWTWWHPDDPAGASRVEIVLTELPSGGTRVAVTERLVGAPAPRSLSAQASARAGRSWELRLLGLELLFLTARLLVG